MKTMETRENILKYAGYMAYIASHALTECGGRPPEMIRLNKELGDLTAAKCRWLVREFNNSIDGDEIRKYWQRLYDSVSNAMRVKVDDFFSIDWDERIVLTRYQEAKDLMKLMHGFSRAVYDYDMDIAEIGARFDKSKNKFREYMGRTLFVPSEVLKAVRNSLPFDEGFPGRFQIACGGGET